MVLDLDGKEFDQTEKPQQTSLVSWVQSRARVWKRLRLVEHSSVSIPDPKRRRGDQDDGGYNPAQVRTRGGVIPWVFVHASRFARFQLARSCMQV